MQSFTFNHTPGRTAVVNGEEYLFFSGYSYFGMQYVPEFALLVKEGIDKYGWVFPSSRISNTRLNLYEECEALLSTITHSENTVLVSSGFVAGRMAVSKWKNEIINLHPSHPAITVPSKNHQTSPAKIFAVDAVDPLTATITDFSFIQRLTENTTFVIDDSHGIGLLGEKGEGITSFLPKNNYGNYVLAYSLSKAFNIHAGAISCPASLAGELRAMPAYTASTAPSPALLHAFTKGQSLYALQREKLRTNIRYFRSLINSKIDQIQHHPLLPIFILPSTFNQQKLLNSKIIISSFAYPDPAGKKVHRIVLNALHTKSDLERLADNLNILL